MDFLLPELRILSEQVANQIAAGEVIERPSAVVKELIENSLDAKADRIDVEFKHGGKTFIKVSDNGHGMRKDQALTCLELHATSKIKNADDLNSVITFGFRGEAVSSIASISKFTLKTCTEKENVGTHIEVYGGKVNFVRECGMARGTEIAVENIFCTVPVRRKFLKSDDTEASHIIKLCKLYALSNPSVAFTLIEDSKVIFKSDRNLPLIDRIGKIFGKDIASKVSPLKAAHAAMTLEGAVSIPNESFSTSRNILAFINGRPVECRAVFSALKEAYRNVIPFGKHPAAFLFLTMNTHDVDVNVHPAKREVRLKNEFDVRNFLLSAIADKLSSFRLADPIAQPSNPSSSALDFKTFSALNNVERELYPKTVSQDANVQPVIHPVADSIGQDVVSQHRGFIPSFEKPDQKPLREDKIASVNWRFLNTIGKKYLLFESDKKSLMIVSVLSALKRINYEHIISNLKGGAIESQSLLIPVNLEFDRHDREVFKNNLKGFLSCGFEIEEFGDNFYRVRSVPSWLDFSEVESFVRGFVELAGAENFAIGKKILSEENFAKLAVKSARGTSFIPTEESANALLLELFQCRNPMFSPDGRPVCKEISEAELSAMFS